jgi:acyl carrier protein
MTNKEKYEQVFINSFSLDRADLNGSLIYESILDWDSVGHMGMVAELEEVFNIELDIDDIIDFSGFEKGKEILNKYNIDFE